jgi:hypothetical protein
LAINAFSAGLWRGRSPTSHLCVSAHSDVLAGDEPAAARSQRAIGQRQRDENRGAVIAQVGEKNAQAFAPWTKQEEEEVKRRFEREKTCNTSLALISDHRVRWNCAFNDSVSYPAVVLRKHPASWNSKP